LCHVKKRAVKGPLFHAGKSEVGGTSQNAVGYNLVGSSAVCIATVFQVLEVHLQPRSALAGKCDSLFIFEALHLCDHLIVVNLNHKNFHSADFLLRRYEYFCFFLSNSAAFAKKRLFLHTTLSYVVYMLIGL